MNAEDYNAKMDKIEKLEGYEAKSLQLQQVMCSLLFDISDQLNEIDKSLSYGIPTYEKNF